MLFPKDYCKGGGWYGPAGADGLLYGEGPGRDRGTYEDEGSGSRNIADLYRAVKAELETQGVGPADQRVRELERGIAAAEHDAAL